jgi:hypothetical protein
VISIYVTVRDTDSSTLIDGHYDFQTVPRVGERVILDNRGGMSIADSAAPLRVTEVVNHAVPKGDVMNPISYVELICEVIG